MYAIQSNGRLFNGYRVNSNRELVPQWHCDSCTLYRDETEAKLVLTEVHEVGYTDAIIVTVSFSPVS